MLRGTPGMRQGTAAAWGQRSGFAPVMDGSGVLQAELWVRVRFVIAVDYNLKYRHCCSS